MITQLVQATPLFALFIGFVPSVIWLVFWLSVDRKHHEPVRYLVACFLLGAAAVLLAKFSEQYLETVITSTNTQLVLFAAIEEVLKFAVFFFVAYNSPYDDEPIEPAMYLITVALGFAALENILYVLQPTIVTNTTAILLTGGLRFFGSTLLHTISSCFIGIMIGITAKKWQPLAIVYGLGGAILLHVAFNFFIFKSGTTANLIQIYGCLIIAAVISHFILEKLRRIPFRIALKEVIPSKIFGK